MAIFPLSFRPPLSPLEGPTGVLVDEVVGAEVEEPVSVGEGTPVVMKLVMTEVPPPEGVITVVTTLGGVLEGGGALLDGGAEDEEGIEEVVGGAEDEGADEDDGKDVVGKLGEEDGGVVSGIVVLLDMAKRADFNP